MATPNTALRAVRLGLRMSQDDLARALRETGQRIGIRIEASKRLIQRWEAGETLVPRAAHARVLELVTGVPVERLGFAATQLRVSPDGAGGHNLNPDPAVVAALPIGATAPGANYSGVWLSRYEYFSSSRGEALVDEKYVIVVQHGNRLSVQTISGSSDSVATMDLTVDGSVVTGTWVEQTSTEGYYRGARYHGAIQMLVDPSGRRMVGKWVGFGKDMDVNTGPWLLIYQDAGTDRATLARYSHPPQS